MPPPRASQIRCHLSVQQTHVTATDLAQAARFRRWWSSRVDEAFATYDLLLTPTLPGTPTVDLSGLPKIKAPILALYPSTDNRTLSTAQPISDEMKKLGKSFEFHVYDGATHGFMHQRSEADYKAATESWPLVVEFFGNNLR